MIYSVLSGIGYDLYESKSYPKKKQARLSGSTNLGAPPVLPMIPADAKYLGHSKTPIGTIAEKPGMGMLVASIISAYVIYLILRRR